MRIRGLGGRGGDEPRGPASGVPSGTRFGEALADAGADGTVAMPLPTGGVEAGESEVMGLVREAQRGNRDAFGALYDRYRREIFRFLLYKTKSHSLAEDLLSETFLRAWKRRESFSWQGRDYGAWLTTIARNLYYDHVKSAAAQREFSSENMLDHDRSEDGPENAVIRSMTGVVVQRAMANLKPEHRECIELRFVRGYSLEETARIMGKKVGAIKALQLRAVGALGRSLPDGLR